MIPVRPFTSRRARSSRKTRAKLTWWRSQVESLEARCLLAVFNPQTPPLVTVVEGSTVTNLEVATFEVSTDGNPNPPIASVAFPAGTTTVATPPVTVTGAAVIDVPGQGTFTEFVVTVNSVTFTGSTGTNQPHYVVGMQDPNDGSAGTSVQGALQVIEAGLAVNSSVGSNTFSEGTTLSGFQLMKFTDGDLSATATDFNATVDWGDGSGVQNAAVVLDSAGNFEVDANHTYLTPGTYSPKVTVTDAAFGGGTLNDTVGPLTITDPVLIAGTAPAALNTQVNSPLINVVLGRFTDPNPFATPSDFAANVTNWGDGESSGATVVETGVDAAGAHFDVLGTHSYAAPLAGGTIALSVQDLSGTNAAVALNTPAVNVTTSGLLASADPVTIVEGNTIPAGTEVGTVTYPNGLAAELASNPAFAITGTATFTDSAGVGHGVALTDVGPGGVTFVNGNTITFFTTAAVTSATGFDAGVSNFTLSATDNLATPDSAFSTSSLTVTDAPLTAGAVVPATTITEGFRVLSSAQLFDFTDGNASATPADFTVTVDWGDGTPTSTGVVGQFGPGSFFVTSGGHIYATPGTYNIKLTVKDNEVGGSQIQSAPSGPITVVPGTITDPGVPVAGVEGSSLDNVPVATFSYSDPLAVPSDFSASIDWGDGSASSPSAGTVIETSANATTSFFTVVGSHNYAQPGSYAVATTVQDLTALPAVVTSTVSTTATVAATGLQLTANPVVVTEGTTIPAGTLIGTVTDPAGIAAGDTITGTVTFPGQVGTTALTGVVSGNTVTFTTTTDTTFTAGSIDEGVFNYTLNATDTPGNGGGTVTTAVAAGELVVKDAPLTFFDTNPGVTPIGTEGNALVNFPLMQFDDANPAATATDFTVSINWGDGTPATTGTVVFDGIHWLVSGTHTFTQNSLGQPGGVYPITIKVTDDGGQTTTGSLAATVADATLTNGTAINVVGSKNQALNNVPVATFVDPNPLATPADINTTINWGDGSAPGAGTVTVLGSAPGGGVIFQVSGSHTYTTSVGSPFTMSVAVTDASNAANTFTVAPTATISASPIGVSVLPISTTVGAKTAAGLLVATFTDPGEANLTTLPGPLTATINWGDGSSDNLASGVTLTALGGGVFGVVAPAGGHAYASPGFYALTVTVNDSDPSSGTGGNLVFVAAATVTAVTTPTTPATATEGSAQTFTLGTFTSSDPGAAASDFKVIVDWGDGSPESAATITPVAAVPGEFAITAVHTYAEETKTPDTITVFVTDSTGATKSGTLQVNVNDAPLTAGTSYPINGPQSVPLNDVPVATFIDANPGATAADFTATITWGDGSGTDTNSRVVLVGGSPAGAIFAVYGSHTYQTTGTYSTTVVVNDVGGNTTTVTGANNVTITQSPILVTGLPIGTFTIDEPTPVNLPVATFLDSGSSDPVTDYTATINWGDGSASQTFAAGQGIVALGGGQFEFEVPVTHTYTNTGQFPITITINDSDPAVGVGGNLAIVIDSVITATPVAGPITAPGGGLYHEGQPLVNVPLATLTDTDLSAQPTDYTVIIDWGDGSPESAGTVIADPAADAADPTLAHFIIEGSHTYAETNLAGYNVQLIATDAFGGKTTASVNIGIADAPLSSALGLPIYASEYGPLNDIPVATFVDANPLGSAGDFTATINWGDGSALDTNARIVLVGANPNGPGLQYAVYGSHVYDKVGTYTTEITVQDEDPNGSSISTTPGTVTVAVTPTPLVVTPAPVTATEGNALPNGQSVVIPSGGTPPTIVATFYDTSGPDPLTDYSALIDWGNGTVTTGTIVQNGTGFEILAPNTTPIVYPEEGNYTIRIALTDSNGGSTAYAIDPVVVADAALTAGTPPTISPTPIQGQPLPQTPGLVLPSAALGTFTDGNPLATPADFSVTIDWGDGSPQSSGYVTQTGQNGTSSGLFTVSGNHTYVSPSTGSGYPVTITIKDAGGSTLTLSIFVKVNASTITVSPQAFRGVEGQPISNVIVAYFSDSGVPGPLSSYSAQIAWNDGSPSTVTPGLIVPLGGNEFEVLGSLPAGYPEEGAYNVSVTIDHNGVAVTNPANGGTIFTATANIADAPLTSAAVPIVATEGAPFTGTIAHFTDLDPHGTATDYSVTIVWGDGTTSTPAAGTGITQPGGPNTPFLVSGTHTYQEEGVYTLSITITDAGGATTTAAEEVNVADAALLPANPQPTVTVPENQLFNGPVATFQDQNPFGAVTDFTATIDWGDGSPNTTGTVEATSTPNVYQVVGSHIYANFGNTINGVPGTFPITTTVRDDGGSVVVIPNSATVTVVAPVVTGRLNPSSDTGKYNNDGITKDNQPDFFGTSTPFSHVRVFATPVGGGTPILLGTTQALSDGSWNIQSNVALADGTYNITATGQDQANLPANPVPTPVTVATNGAPNVLTIATKGPRVASTTFDRANGTIAITFDDASGPGVLAQSIEDAANYVFNNQLARPLGKYIVGAINVTPGPAAGEMTALLTIEQTQYGKPLPNRVLRGFFQITAVSASVIDTSGIQDLAGNALDGEFYGPNSESGNGVPGGNFVANFNDFHNIINPPATVLGFPHPNDPPVPVVKKPVKTTHLGVSHPTAPVVKTPVKTSHHTTVTPKAAHPTVHEHALERTVAPKRKPR